MVRSVLENKLQLIKILLKKAEDHFTRLREGWKKRVEF
jgi:hypothetical protein